jgi:hypothetical protein
MTTQTSRRLSAIANELVPGMRCGQGVMNLVTGLSAPRICGGQSRQWETLGGRLVRQIGVHPICQCDKYSRKTNNKCACGAPLQC